MSREWLAVPLQDYEGHMGASGVAQLPALAELFEWVLARWRPESVAVLGVAGGNGLDRVDCSVTKRIVGVDIHPEYLTTVSQRFATLPGLELHCLDLTEPHRGLTPVALVHAALVFEHVGLDAALNNALSLVAPGGLLSVVLQLPSAEEQAVALTGYASIQGLKDNFRLIDRSTFQGHLAARGLRLVEQQRRDLPSGKGFWLGVFRR